MNCGFIVSSMEKATDFFLEALAEYHVAQVVTCVSVEDARMQMTDMDFAIINHPVGMESGIALAKDWANATKGQVILLVRAEEYESVAPGLEKMGIITLCKPTNRSVMGAILHAVSVTQTRLLNVESERDKLETKLEDFKLIGRAKCTLISRFGMDEQKAHRYIEKQAMDMRLSRRNVAENILRTYEY